MKVILNEKYLDSDKPILTAANRAFRYGDGLFETIKVINGRPQFLERHLFRLLKSMDLLGMKMNQQLTLHYLESMMLDLLQVNNIQEGGRIRLSVYREDGGFYAPNSDEVNVFIEASHGANTYEYNDSGEAFDIYNTYCKPINEFSSIKSASAVFYVMASRALHNSEHDELLLVNEANRLCEATASNLFLVKNKVLITHPLEEGVLPGIMRERVIYLAKSNRIRVEESLLEKRALEDADEVFTTNAISGIKWFKAYRKKRYFNTISKKLHQYLVAQ
jgi:branched-chain amino acid aminotransferase